jgi:hypothetical protein
MSCTYDWTLAKLIWSSAVLAPPLSEAWIIHSGSLTMSQPITPALVARTEAIGATAFCRKLARMAGEVMTSSWLKVRPLYPTG